MNKKDFTSILDSVKDDAIGEHKNSRVLVVDSMNTFLRCFCVVKNDIVNQDKQKFEDLASPFFIFNHNFQR